MRKPYADKNSYLVADYERSSFSIYQRKWDANAKSDIQTILPPSVVTDYEGGALPKNKSTRDSHNHASVAIIIASVLGGVILMIVVAGCIILLRRRIRKGRKLRSQQPPGSEKTVFKQPRTYSCSGIISSAPTLRTELDAMEILKRSPELDAVPAIPRTRDRIYELPINEIPVAELIGSPVPEKAL